jgi:hypothetical protein
MGVGEAAYVLGLSERHTWRILSEYSKDDAADLIHGNQCLQLLLTRLRPVKPTLLPPQRPGEPQFEDD